jgi:D-alanyl-D-alanine dipeptidase
MKKICSVLFFVSVFSFFLSSCISINSEYKLINIQQLDSTIIVDVKYATENNFTGKILYQSSKAFLIEDAAKNLVKANEYLKENYGLRLKLYDGYRPLSVQKKMWEIIPDERYVANPQKGSRHNRGCAVDLTLIDSTGKELDMGTPYDDFSEKSHIDFFQFPDTVINNRKLLQEVMIKFGFIPLKTEWWHFDYKDWEKYPVLDIEIK